MSVCKYRAPFFAFERVPKRYGVKQGNCHHWDCPLHGEEIAREHYGRIVEGARKLDRQGVKLAFWTVTCRGKDLDAEYAFEHYLEWTNRLLDAARAKATRATRDHEPEPWSYVQVTEKQDRSHPHSHLLMSFMPADTVLGFVEKWAKGKNGWRMTIVPALRSDWLAGEVVKAGLGEQYDISEIETIEAASRYVAKYMFKRSQFTDKFPPGWKRVRYSHSWPKLPEVKTNAFPLLSREDWGRLSASAVVIDAKDERAYRECVHWLGGEGIPINRAYADEGE